MLCQSKGISVNFLAEAAYVVPDLSINNYQFHSILTRSDQIQLGDTMCNNLVVNLGQLLLCLFRHLHNIELWVYIT